MNQWDIQKAVFTKLSELSTPIYDHVPQGTKAPYINIGEDTSIEWDTDTELGSESTITIHVWSTKPGRSECKQLMQEVYDSLHRQMLYSNGIIYVNCVWEFAESFLDPDGVTRHGVMRFRIITQKE